MLSTTAIAFLSPLTYRADAQRQTCFMPLGGIYWEDEIPDFELLFEIPEHDRYLIFRLFSIRFTLWAGKELPSDDQRFLDEARSQVPTYPLFRRLKLDADDRRAQEEFEQSAIKSFEELFADADEVKLTQKGGVGHFSATFDLTEQSPASKPPPWWKRWWRRN
jgi:hypothetical protein